MLATLPLQLRDLLGTDAPTLRRLFPVAYHLDAEHEAEFQRLMREDLLARRIGAAEALAASAEAKVLETDEEINTWIGAINDLRLVLGTQLDVSEDSDDLFDLDLAEDDPRAAQIEVYSWLGFMLEMLIRAATSEEETAAPSFFDGTGFGDHDPTIDWDAEFGAPEGS
jgi:Domain of unknown function (DUF2017)